MLAALALATILTTPPPGAVLFCMTHPTECADAPATTAPASALSLLRRVNDDVNDRIASPRDMVEFTALRLGPWLLNPARGVCRDYALTKRHDLIADGVSPGAMSLAYARLPRTDDYHLVLLVRTTTDTYVLDNLTSTVWTYDQTTEVYDYVSRQDYGHPQRWIQTP